MRSSMLSKNSQICFYQSISVDFDIEFLLENDIDLDTTLTSRKGPKRVFLNIYICLDVNLLFMFKTIFLKWEQHVKLARKKSLELILMTKHKPHVTKQSQ